MTDFTTADFFLSLFLVAITTGGLLHARRQSQQLRGDSLRSDYDR